MSPEDASLIWYPAGTAIALIVFQISELHNPWSFPTASAVLGIAYGMVNDSPAFCLGQIVIFAVSAVAGLRWYCRKAERESIAPAIDAGFKG
ncbi:MAG: hypothetical protein IT203_10975 [Fimbriimonadaceae bacterium]|nr:hypothetical protein [Fimbriimonadaceae bacterium]